MTDAVYEPIQRYLYRRCAADDVDDVFNDILLTLWRRLDDTPVGQELPWAYGIARRCLANHWRTQTRRSHVVKRAITMTTTEPHQPWTDDADVALHEALDKLSDLDRETLRLWAWERLEPSEIAAVLDVTPNAIRVRLARTRRRLEQELARHDQPLAGHEPDEGHLELEP